MFCDSRTLRTIVSMSDSSQVLYVVIAWHKSTLISDIYFPTFLTTLFHTYFFTLTESKHDGRLAGQTKIQKERCR